MGIAVATSVGCGQDPRLTGISVHRGWDPTPNAETWSPAVAGEILVHRDNPPLQGWMKRLGGTLVRRTVEDDWPRESLTGLRLGAFVWDRVNVRVEWSVQRGDELVHGELGVTQLPDYALGRFDVSQVRWRTNGMQLRPGEPMEFSLRQRIYDPAKMQWQWQNAFAPLITSATVRLALNTRIVAVAVGVLDVEAESMSESATRLTETDAQAWFDGRAVDSQHSITSSGGNLNEVILDRDPRPDWTLANFNQPWAGRSPNTLAAMQEPDAVWSQCGARFDRGVQFKLVRYRPIRVRRSDHLNCRNVAIDGGGPTFDACFNDWLQALQGDDQGRRISMIVMPRYNRNNAIAEVMVGSNNVVVGLTDLLNNQQSNRASIIAHELGHALGPNSHLFNDGYFEAGDIARDNLMSGGARTLITAAQCEVAWTTARGLLAQ